MKILFYSNKAYALYNKYNDVTNVLLNFFDIEIQKILRALHYNYKKNPVLVTQDNFVCFKNIIYSYDLDNYKYCTIKNMPIKSYAVIYDCF